MTAPPATIQAAGRVVPLLSVTPATQLPPSGSGGMGGGMGGGRGGGRVGDMSGSQHAPPTAPAVGLSDPLTTPRSTYAAAMTTAEEAAEALAHAEKAKELRKHIRDLLLVKAQRVIDTFNEMDKDHSLTIDEVEFSNAMSALGVSDADEISEIWQSLDADGSGEIAYQELISAVNPHLTDHKPSANALDPHNKHGAFRYGKREAAGAGQAIERNHIRDTHYNADARMKTEAVEAHFQKGLRNDRVDFSKKFEPKQKVAGKLPGLSERLDMSAGTEAVRGQLRDALQEMATSRIIDVFRAWDFDDSGSVSYQEFATAMVGLGVNASKDEMAQIFSEFDVDGSGEIDYKEIKRALTPDRAAIAAKRKSAPKAKHVPPGLPAPRGEAAAQRAPKPSKPSRRAAGGPLESPRWQEGLEGSAQVSLLRDILLHKAHRVIDTFREWDSDHSMTISYDEFALAMRSIGVDVPADVASLWAQIDLDGSGEIAYAELLGALNPRAAAAHVGSSADALDPNNERKAFKYGKQQADDAARLIERSSGVRDEDYATMEEHRRRQRNPNFR